MISSCNLKTHSSAGWKRIFLTSHWITDFTTSAKEVMFSSQWGMCVKYFKKLQTDFDKIFWRGESWPKEQADFGGDRNHDPDPVFLDADHNPWLRCALHRVLSSWQGNAPIVAWGLSCSISHGDDFEKTAFECFDHAVPKCLLAWAFSSRQFRQ